MITELDHIYNIPIDCKGKECVPAILLSVNKMVAIVGDIWQQLTSLVGVNAVGIPCIVAVGYADLQMGDAGGWSWVLGNAGHALWRCGFVINILGKLRGTGLRASFLRKRFGWRCLLVIVDQKNRDNPLTSSSVSFTSRSLCTGKEHLQAGTSTLPNPIVSNTYVSLLVL